MYLLLLACFSTKDRSEDHPPIILQEPSAETDEDFDTSDPEELDTNPPTDSAIEECIATIQSNQNEHYRSDPPIRNDLNLYGAPVQTITIRGLTQNASCGKERNLRIQAWHADQDGQYDTTSDEYRYYGEFISNGEGFYEFFTIYPGAEKIASNQYKPAQIHIKVFDGEEEKINTTIYFSDDPFLVFGEDIPEENIIELVDDGNILVGVISLIF